MFSLLRRLFNLLFAQLKFFHYIYQYFSTYDRYLKLKFDRIRQHFVLVFDRICPSIRTSSSILRYNKWIASSCSLMVVHFFFQKKFERTLLLRVHWFALNLFCFYKFRNLIRKDDVGFPMQNRNRLSNICCVTITVTSDINFTKAFLDVMVFFSEKKLHWLKVLCFLSDNKLMPHFIINFSLFYYYTGLC